MIVVLKSLFFQRNRSKSVELLEGVAHTSQQEITQLFGGRSDRESRLTSRHKLFRML